MLRAGREKVHPELAIDFFVQDCARLRPADIPLALICRQNNALALPVDEIRGSREAKLRIMLVVARVSEVVSLAPLHDSRIFHAAIFFVVHFRREDRLRAAFKVNPVSTFRVAEARSSVGILRAVEHDELALALDNAGIERPRSFPGCALWRNNRRLGCTLPRA